MKRWISLASALIIATGAAIFAYQTLPEPVPEPTIDIGHPEPTGPSPKLEVVGEKSYQFGTLLEGKKGSHTWEFRNVGAGPLEVWLEDTTCSCTAAFLKSSEGEKAERARKGQKITIGPGRSSPVQIDYEGRRPGRYGQAATLGTSDPDNRTVILSILGTVLPPVEVRPAGPIAFPDGPPEEPRRITVDVVSNDRPELKLTKVATSRPALIVAEPRPISPAELERMRVKAGYHVSVEIRPGMPPGRFSEEVLVETEDPVRSMLKVVIGGNTVGPITVVPERVGMPSVASRTGGSQDLSLIVRGNQETHFEVARKPEPLQVAIVQDEASRLKGRYKMTVTVPPGTATGRVAGDIVLKTDHPKVKEVRIPVAIYVSTRSEG